MITIIIILSALQEISCSIFQNFLTDTLTLEQYFRNKVILKQPTVRYIKLDKNINKIVVNYYGSIMGINISQCIVAKVPSVMRSLVTFNGHFVTSALEPTSRSP